MDPKLKQLEDILKRNSEQPQSIDIENEVDHYFFFDKISNENDLEEAWSIFEEAKAIQERLLLVESNSKTLPVFGYRIPENEQALCSNEELTSLVRSHITNLRPLLLEEDYNEEIISFIDQDFAIEIAPPDINIPNTSDNQLFGVLYEAIGEYWIEHFPYHKPHYEVIKNWSIYLTKCDEVATYLMWPILENRNDLTANTFEPGTILWKLGCRDRYWVKDLDYHSKVIYVRAPWHDKQK